MTPAERIVRVLLWLYPAEHRQAYGTAMLQHARDLNLAERQRGRRHVVTLYTRLTIDGIVNAAIEQMEAVMASKNNFKPVPWLSVLLATIPGLWIALSRRNADQFALLLSILGILYLALLVLVPLIEWWRKRRYPVWVLLPVGMLTWVLTFLAGNAFTTHRNLFGVGESWLPGVLFIDLVLTIGIFVAFSPLSLNVLLSLVVAWVLYNHISENLTEAQLTSLVTSPLPG